MSLDEKPGYTSLVKTKRHSTNPLNVSLLGTQFKDLLLPWTVIWAHIYITQCVLHWITRPQRMSLTSRTYSRQNRHGPRGHTAHACHALNDAPSTHWRNWSSTPEAPLCRSAHIAKISEDICYESVHCTTQPEVRFQREFGQQLQLVHCTYLLLQVWIFL